MDSPWLSLRAEAQAALASIRAARAYFDAVGVPTKPFFATSFTFALAEQTGRLVLGVDLNLAMLRVAASALHRGVVQYPRKRTGVVYDRRRLPVSFPCAEQVDFWACDVGALPFPEKKFALAAALNLLDCVPAPRDLLAEVTRTLVPGGSSSCKTNSTAGLVSVIR